MGEDALKFEREDTAWYISAPVYILRLIFGGMLGWFTVRLVEYFRRLFKQPYLPPYSVTLDTDELSGLQSQALAIAVANLQDGIEPRLLPDGSQKLVVCAGRRNFREPWARDLSFASFGLVELGSYQAVRESLEVFLANQRPDGQFPIKAHSTGVFNRFLHSLFRREQPILAPLQPKYMSGHRTISLDGNALLVIAALNYADRAGDTRFSREHWPKLRRAMIWLGEHAHDDGLLHQEAFSDWADTIARVGRVLYTNVIYWKALKDMAAAGARLGFEGDASHFSFKATQLIASVNNHFWREDLGYFITNEEFENLSSAGNLLAIAWGLANRAQANAILDKMRQFGMADPVPTQPVHPAYPSRFVAIENRLGRIGFYHINAAWLWLGAWHVIALSRAGRMDEAEQCIDRISEVIVGDGAVHEVYAPDGRYVNGLWYNSEAPFTWSAGMVAYADHVFQRHLADKPIGH
jgi:glycogen debranching enzyme